MNEKVFKSMGRIGGANIVLGVISIVAGISIGVISIVCGGNLLHSRKDLIF